MKIVIPDPIDLHEKHIEELRKLGNVTIYNDVPKSEDEIIKRIQNAEIITANWIDIAKNIIDHSPSLKYIIVPAVGYEWVDVKVATSKGIKVLNCPTHNGYAVAELTIGLLFDLLRKITDSNQNLKKGEWEPTKYKGTELKGKKLGIIGYGILEEV